jgi:hypothetical protein
MACHTLCIDSIYRLSFRRTLMNNETCHEASSASVSFHWRSSPSLLNMNGAGGLRPRALRHHEQSRAVCMQPTGGKCDRGEGRASLKQRAVELCQKHPNPEGAGSRGTFTELGSRPQLAPTSPQKKLHLPFAFSLSGSLFDNLFCLSYSKIF